MTDTFDVAILGAGPGGEHAAYALHARGCKVLLVERELIGGECSNWACIPTKTLLRPTEVRGESERAAGTRTAELDWPELDKYRDYMTSAGDDSARVKGYEDMGVTVVKGDGRLAGRGALEVDGRRFEADRILISTGSEPVIPPIEGLAEAGYWTNREATAMHEVPASAVVAGGGPVGVELAQFMRRFGAEVTLVQGVGPARRPRGRARLASCCASRSSATGSPSARACAPTASTRDGDRAGRLARRRLDRCAARSFLIAVGRKPRGHDIGLETIGVDARRARRDPDRRALPGGRRGVGGRRLHRRDAVHAPGQVPGPGGDGRHVRAVPSSPITARSRG